MTRPLLPAILPGSDHLAPSAQIEGGVNNDRTVIVETILSVLLL